MQTSTRRPSFPRLTPAVALALGAMRGLARGAAGCLVVLGLAACGAGAETFTESGDGERYSASGVVVDVSSCKDAEGPCAPKALASARVCAGDECVEADDGGRFQLEGLQSLDVAHEPAVSVKGKAVVLAFTGAADEGTHHPVRGVSLAGKVLRVEFDPAFPITTLELGSLQASIRPYAFEDGLPDAELHAEPGLIGSATLAADGRTLEIPVLRFPFPGQSVLVRANVAPGCEGCEAHRVDLVRLVGGSSRGRDLTATARADSSQVLPPLAMTAFSHATLDTTAAGTAAINDKHAALGGNTGPLGAPLAAVQTVSGGLKRRYSAGTIYWSAATGAHAVWGAIHTHYVLWGADTGLLGRPITDEVTAPDGIGKFTYFQNAAIYWTPSTGARMVFGAILVKWGELAWEGGFLGYPVTDSLLAPDGVGVFNYFQGGAIYWTPSTGAHEVHGIILSKWESLGWELGVLGYPTSDEGGTPDGIGRFNHFQNGSIYWTPATGAREVHGAIHTKWAALGWEQSDLGYPVGDEGRTPDGIGKFNHFQDGSIYWTSTTGANAVLGDIRSKWSRYGWERSALGYPTSDELPTSAGGRVSNFQNGQINWKLHGGPLKVFTQNMAFLVAPAPYLGSDCDIVAVTGTFASCGALDSLAAFLKREQPDIVGLEEMFDQQAVDYLLADREILGMYPHRLQGPDEDVILGVGGSDGGLLLLSRFPIVASDSIIFRKCGGLDCFAAKGVLYAHVESSPGVLLDVFLSHTQNPDEGGTDASLGELHDQMEMFGSFVQAKRASQQFPAIIMGDLNINGLEPNRYAQMMTALWNPIDTWTATNGAALGITADDNGFFTDQDSRDGPRGVSGDRLDYILVHQGDRFELPLESSRIVMERASNNTDISDHYGVLTTFSHQARELDAIYTGRVSNVQTRLVRFHGFEVTDGTLDWLTPGDNNDELEWTLGLRIDQGVRSTARSGRINGVSENYDFWWFTPPTTNRGPMGNLLAIDVEGQEIDDACFLFFGCAITGRASLGRHTLFMSKEQLFESLHGSRFYSLGMMRGDNGEYMATVEITSRR